jgi:DNA-directed RNA polymerase specialized sigma24 family protein
MELTRPATPAGLRPVARSVGLSREAFQGLLSLLGEDEEHAAQEYERLRQKLIIFFSGRGCPEPEESTDVTIDRLSRRIDEGEQIRNVRGFAYGVARLVLSESLRRRRRRRRALDYLASAGAPSPWGGFTETYESDAAVECVRGCAGRLPPDDRELILRYYESAGRDRQHERREIALRLGLSSSALRLRAYRIRRVLETCTRRCLAAQGVVQRSPDPEAERT